MLLVSKLQISHTSISGITGPKFTIFVYIVDIAIKLLIHVVIFYSVLECQGAEWRSFPNFAQNWLPWQRTLSNRKNLSGLTTYTQIISIWWKNRENRSSRSWDSFAQFKKRKKRKVKYIARSELSRSCKTSISANADGPRDSATRKIDHIALRTEFSYQSTTSIQRARDIGPPSTALLISLNVYRGEFFFKVHSCACENGSREHNHAIATINLCTKYKLI